MHKEDIESLVIIFFFILGLLVIIKILKILINALNRKIIPSVKNKSDNLLQDHRESKMLKDKELYDNDLISKEEYEARIEKLKAKKTYL